MQRNADAPGRGEIKAADRSRTDASDVAGWVRRPSGSLSDLKPHLESPTVDPIQIVTFDPNCLTLST
jgi:hypothetical protein